MTGLYIFLLSLGAPLLIWFAAAGGDSDAGGDGDTGKLEGVFTVIPLSTIAMTATFFGGTGLALSAIGANPVITVLLAAAIGVGAAMINTAVFKWLRANEASSEATNRDIEGNIAEVILPVSDDQRGKIVLTVTGARTQMTASPVTPGENVIDAGSRVLVVRVAGGVAYVEPVPPELDYESF